MNTSKPKAGERIVGVHFTDEQLAVELADGRIISVPLSWYPRLFNATPTQRERWEIAGAGFGIHWPDVDEDLSVHGLLAGSPAPGVRIPLKTAG